jgi:hypothetical protein
MNVDFSLILILFSIILGISLAYVGYLDSKRIISCTPRVEYRFVPRTFSEELKEPIDISDLFKELLENSYFEPFEVQKARKNKIFT